MNCLKVLFPLLKKHEEFYKNQLLPFFEIDSPSDKIINILEKHLCEIKENK